MLNPEQQEAVDTTEGPLLIIAGPGSGKTTTLVQRVYHLLADLNVAPENIFISTFTEKAAKELVSKISKLLYANQKKINVNDLCIGTMHSIFLHLLEEFRDYTTLNKNYTVWDSFDQQYIVSKNIFSFQALDPENVLLKRGNWWKQAKQIVSLVGKVSEEAVSPDILNNHELEEIKILGKFYAQYEKLLDRENALDFSSIQSKFLKLLEENEDVLNTLRKRFRYFMIDEYQDTNTVQEKILLKLLNDEKNICVVGDDDQSLYRFRGASVRNILEFEKHFNGKCKKIKLERNYRSHSGIIDFYNEWMLEEDWDGDNDKKFRFEKKVVSGKEPHEHGEYPSVLTVSAQGDELWANDVVSFLKKLKNKGRVTDWNQIVFLFKSVKGDHAKNLARILEDEGINVYTPRSSMFFDRIEIKLALGAICTVLHRYYQSPNEYHQKFSGYMTQCISLFKEELSKDSELRSFFRVKKREIESISFQNLDYAFSGLFYQLIQYDFLARFIKGIDTKRLLDSRPLRNLAILSNLLTKFESLENINIFTEKNIERTIKKFIDNFLSYMYEGGIEEYEDEIETTPSGCVSFMTIHQSKGLEFPIVFVCSLWESPKKAYSDIDEKLQDSVYEKQPFEPLGRIKDFDFRRLYYTAYSRAKNLLCLSCPRKPVRYFLPSYEKAKNWHELSDEDWKNIPCETVDKKRLKNEYSFTSDIILYENCPLQYKFFKELEFSPVREGTIAFGTLVHETIEDVHKAVIKGNSEQVTEEQIRAWFNQNYEDLKKSDHIYLTQGARDSALGQVFKYVEREKDNLKKVKEAEVELSLVEENYILKGKIDLLRGQDGTLEILDFKAEKKPDVNLDEGRERLEKYKRQLQIYAHLVEQKYPTEKVAKMSLYYTNTEEGSPYVSFPKHDLSITETIKGVASVVEKIEKHDYSLHTRKEKQCRECDMRYFCNKHC